MPGAPVTNMAERSGYPSPSSNLSRSVMPVEAIGCIRAFGIRYKEETCLRVVAGSAKQKYDSPEPCLHMAKFDGIVGKALLTVEERENEITLVFADNRFLFVRLENGKLKSDSVPE